MFQTQVADEKKKCRWDEEKSNTKSIIRSILSDEKINGFRTTRSFFKKAKERSRSKVHSISKRGRPSTSPSSQKNLSIPGKSYASTLARACRVLNKKSLNSKSKQTRIENRTEHPSMSKGFTDRTELSQDAKFNRPSSNHLTRLGFIFEREKKDLFSVKKESSRKKSATM